MFKKTLLVGLVCAFLAPSSAFAEWYAGGAVGIAIPHNVDDLAVSGSGFSVDISSFSPETAFTGGIKGGYFFESIPYLGAEINWSMSSPDVNLETINATITGTPTGAFVGRTTGDFLGSVDVDSVSSLGFLAMLRVTDKDATEEYSGMQPYLGLGFTITTLDVNSVTIFNTAGTQLGTTANSDSSTDVGFLLSTGLNYIVSDKIKVYSEYKFQTVEHTLTMDEGVDSKLTAELSSVVFGVTYSF